MQKFKAKLDIIGINPFVFLPEKILKNVFEQAGKDKGHIPVCGTINEKDYKQTLVKYSGSWRLYINTTMLPHSPKRIGETIIVTIQFDPADRTNQPHDGLTKAIAKNAKAKKAFDNLSASRQKEIMRYISSLKTKESVTRNIERVIGFLTEKNRFAGRDKP